MDVFEQQHKYVDLFAYVDVDSCWLLLLACKLSLNDNRESSVRMDRVNRPMAAVQVSKVQQVDWMLVEQHEDEKDDVRVYCLMEVEFEAPAVVVVVVVRRLELEEE